MDVARRALALIWIALHPWSAALEPTVSKTGASAAAALLGLALLAALAGVAVWRRWWLVAASGMAVLGAALFGAVRFVGSNGPLGRGSLVLTPLVWLLVMAILQVAAGPRLPRDAARPTTAVLGAAALSGIALLLGGYERLASRAGQWRAVLASDPGNETAALFVAQWHAQGGRNAASLEIVEACARANPAACQCVRSAASAALNAGKLAAARSLFGGAPLACQSTAFAGIEANILAQEGKLEAARTAAERADKNDPNALYALGLERLAAKDWPAALAFGTKAEAVGGGTGARLLIGSAQLGAGELASARATFQRAVAADSTSAVAHYHVGLVADREGKYHDAREGYLAALRADANLVEARYALVVLTGRNGAVQEAQNHLAKLRALAPNDPRLPALVTLLSGSSNNP